MRRQKLDKIDKKILRRLQKDGRVTNIELANDVGISAPPCLRRVRVLENNGYIKGYHARINAPAMGYTVTVFAMVKLASHAEGELLKFEKKIKDWPLIRECFMIAGDVDFILKVVARDWDHYQEFLTNELTGITNVVSVKSALAIRTAKEEEGIPIEE